MKATFILTLIKAASLGAGVTAVAIGISRPSLGMTIFGLALLSIHSSVNFVWKD